MHPQHKVPQKFPRISVCPPTSPKTAWVPPKENMCCVMGKHRLTSSFVSTSTLPKKPFTFVK